MLCYENFVYILLFFFLSASYYAEIPIIVISAGKLPQSKGTVGSDVTVIDRKKLKILTIIMKIR